MHKAKSGVVMIIIMTAASRKSNDDDNCNDDDTDVETHDLYVFKAIFMNYICCI